MMDCDACIEIRETLNPWGQCQDCADAKDSNEVIDGED
jgi:hypothetical protein